MPRYGMKQQRWVTLPVEEIRRETDKAFCLKVAERQDDVWIPKSQMRDPTQHHEGEGECEVEVTEWIAQQKDLPTEYTTE